MCTAFGQKVTPKRRYIWTSLHGVTTQKPRQPQTSTSWALSTALRVLCYVPLTKHVLQHHTTHTRVNTDYILEALYEERCAFVGKACDLNRLTDCVVV